MKLKKGDILEDNYGYKYEITYILNDLVVTYLLNNLPTEKNVNRVDKNSLASIQLLISSKQLKLVSLIKCRNKFEYESLRCH